MTIRKKPISAERAVGVSLVVDVLDIVVNLAAAIITGSVVMLAETLQGTTDFIADCFTWIGLKRSRRKETKKYPFGYGRELYVWTLFSSLVMFGGLASLTFYFGWQRFWDPSPIEYIGLAYIVLSISIVTNGYSLSVGMRRLLQGIEKNPIRAYLRTPFIETRATVTLDVIGTLAAISGLSALILFEVTGDPRFDGVGAMAIGILMGFFSFLLLREAKNFLVGKSVDERTMQMIKQAAGSVEGVQDIVRVRAVLLGLRGMLVNIDVHAKDGLVTDEIEVLIDRIEQHIREAVPAATYIQVELETPSVNNNQ